MAKQTTKIQKTAPVVSSIPEVFTVVEFKTPDVDCNIVADNSATNFLSFVKLIKTWSVKLLGQARREVTIAVQAIVTATLFSKYIDPTNKNYKLEKLFEEFHSVSEIISILPEVSESLIKRQIAWIFKHNSHRVVKEVSSDKFRLVAIAI